MDRLLPVNAVPPILPATLAALGVRGGATGGIGKVISTVSPSPLVVSLSHKALLLLLLQLLLVVAGSVCTDCSAWVTVRFILGSEA
jgi:hypothetical protein